MPDVSIAGEDLINVHEVTINISLSGGEAVRLPDCSATITVPTDEQTLLHDWILAKQGPDRFKKVEITTYDRSKSKNKTWTFAKAFISTLHEGEYSGGGANMTTFTIIGTLIHAKVAYDGNNILEVKPGDVEAVPG